MINKELRIQCLSAFSLKILACVFMLVDHIGCILLQDVIVLRYIGRLSFPIFAYFIAEGCRYTKNKLKRFLSVFVLGLVCELVFIIFSKEYYGNILLTFSVSILLIYLLDSVKKAYFKSKKLFFVLMLSLGTALVLTYAFCKTVGLDYGFFGVLAPVLAVAFDNLGGVSKKLYGCIERKTVSLFMLSVSLLMICIFWDYEDYQILSLLSVVLLALYNGERGKHRLKYFFYFFYPLHLAILQGIAFVFQK